MTDTAQKFVHLHVHTQYSLLDGAIRIDALLNRAENFGMNSVAITDHGTMFGVVEFYEKAVKAGIKPIVGCECYLAPRSIAKKDKSSYHLVLLAQNDEGYRNLCKMASVAQLKGFYYKPRIDKELLKAHSKGLIGLSACLKGEVPSLIRQGKTDEADAAAKFYTDLFGEGNFFLELQNNGLKEQEIANEGLLDMSQRLSIPMVATNDCHYLDKEDVRAHEVLLCIQTGKTMNDADRFRFETDQLYFKPPDIMNADFRDYPGALENTADIAEKCQIEFDFKTYHFPQFDADSGLSPDELFEQKTRAGFEKRLGEIRKKHPDTDEKIYNERLDYEIGIINQMGFPGYFLIVADFIQYAKENGVPVGPGRGCIVPDSKVLLADGTETEIRKIKADDHIITHLGNILPVRDKMAYDCDEEIVRIDAANEMLSLTQDHKVWAVRSETCTVDTPKTRPIVCEPACKRYCSPKPSEHYHPEWIRAGQLRKNDFVVFPRIASENRDIVFDVSKFVERKTHLKYDENSLWYEMGTNRMPTKKVPRYVPFDENFAKLLGCYISEGWSTHGERECAPGFGFHRQDTEYAQELQHLLEAVFGLESRIIFRNSLQVIGYSKIAGEFLASLCGKDANNRHIPLDIVSDGKDESLRTLIAYMFRGGGHDGACDETISIKYSTTSPVLASQLRFLLARFGYWTTLLRQGKEKGTEISVKLAGRQLLRWNDDFPAFSPRHSPQNLCGNDSFCVDEQYIYLRIKETGRSAYKGKVYDISVPPDTSYVANSMAIHNSAAGSMVAYSLGITDLDPIEHGLIFERFLNPARVSMPDIDVDFCINGREQVFRYVVDRYGGGDYVAQIITFGKLKTRAVIRDVGRALDIPLREVDAIAKMVPDVLNISLDDALRQEPRIREMAKNDARIKDLISICRVLEGLPRHASTHAAGVVIGDKPLAEYLPLYKGKKGEVVTQFDMKYVEKIGLVKFDFLGLRNLTVIENALSLIREGRDESPDLLNIDFEDADTYKLLSAGDTTGVFQLESSGMKDLLARLKPACFDDIIALVALYRPGPLDSGMVDDFVERKHGRKKVEYLVSELEPILKSTYGVIVYQEQVMQIAGELASYSMAEADGLRKAMGKKIAEIMAEHRDRFVKGSVENKIDKNKATQLFDLMEKFGGYGFNKSHSAAYALIAYQTAYLKAHYPVEFMASLLTSEMHSIDGVVKYIAECRGHGIEVLPPDINESLKEFTVSHGKIRFGLVAVKNVGEGPIEAIIEARKTNVSFTSLFDFCEKVDFKKLNKRLVEGLIRCGAFDSTGAHRSQMIEVMEEAIDYGQRIQKEKSGPQMSLFDVGGDTQAINAPSLPDMPEWDEKQLLEMEKESLGFYISGHPLNKFESVLARFGNANTLSLKDKNDGQPVKIGGIVRNIKLIKDRKNKDMAFVTTEDMHGMVETTVFSSVYETAREILTEDSAILIDGTLQKDEKSVKLLANSIIPINKAEEIRTESIHFNMDMTRTDRGMLEKLHGILKKHPGACQAYLHLLNPKTAETVIALPKTLRLKPDALLHDEVSGQLGKDGVRTFFKPDA